VARPDLRNRDNVDGDWFVDTRCIDCGTCRELSPEIFGDVAGLSVVVDQPVGGPARLEAWLAAEACPTRSIGTLSRARRPGRLYPREIGVDTDVFDCGYCAESSFGASAWFVARPAGNLLIDSPRFTEALAAPITERGGIRHVLLTHQDDVADGRRWAERFAARVWIHEDDARAAPFATDHLRGLAPTVVQDGVVAVPTPGHTAGSAMFLVDGAYLFTGDSLAWSHSSGDLTAFRDACWFSWSAQTESLERLAAEHRFSWVLPGHGARAHDDPEVLHRRLLALTERMRAPRRRG
jgi:glyoxylase-like metal-dependent hydrolase (beta-lactamase superfamily II)/ferredoxin